MSVLAVEGVGRRVLTVNPVAKIAALVPLTICLLLTLDWLSATVAVVGELVLFLAAGLRGRRLWRRTVPLLVAAPLAGVTMVLYGRPSGQTYLQLGLVHVTEGSVAIGLATTARLVAIALPAVVLLATIDPTDLADGLAQRWRLPSRFVLGALAGLRLVGLFLQDWRSLELARRARGVADSGRLRRSAGQVLALLVLAVRRGSRLATAMEARGFDGPGERSWARPSPVGRAEVVTVACGVLLGVLCVGAALLAGTWNFVLT
ncbi:MAG: Transmembrane component YkoC of energizing module of thiamin-regulated ECF transporter for HydroxyMethylPyrimidine [uncultured Friedmanniella sp.]|uniref:Transmembrane component YkoC of energizing module of thiamin-regulated ECF transporter for HydroxyMethylPyrimidine n=1 Tax=uncultured Friedmanniella sp. TaxID=335381 RepID=A0A6J4LEH0_9ACTN|nr:MAG: Transmembrane component YkoC of energizing module of thiamin-regulated ECF transporter for HydroxyMethylPyrimidine [uncultured Friedmanniella sp.]